MSEKITLAHGSGGKLSHELISSRIFSILTNPLLASMDDAAVFSLPGKTAFTTDSFVISPLFFPGGDIGRLSVCGTVNDLAVMGARPLYLSLGLIIEEGLDFSDLDKIMQSVRQAASESNVNIVTGDTKVVNHGCADRLFINTSGLGIIPEGLEISGSLARPGDRIILNGTLGDHAIAVMARRENLRLKVPVESDCTPLNGLVESLFSGQPLIHCMRDPTRGGLATTLNEIAHQSSTGIRIFEEKIPVKTSVSTVCSMLGLDPLFLANEGKLVVFCAPQSSEQVLAAMRRHPYGLEAAEIGEVVPDHPGRVVLQTRLGASRIIEMLSGELLPRIC